ncbi:hypothetical protein P1X15_07530 [Runella sp. MFBS21]|uniref:hypothetical protein n=1 Tax=Runella sp. MFBS21 TaxID=3034018 RepID=UPI0023F832D0|nr:hypothetical protein [Runella sp. MFBS21]MDF7817439.1 hypothetical protein [Runella sp. MFBS21]
MGIDKSCVIPPIGKKEHFLLPSQKHKEARQSYKAKKQSSKNYCLQGCFFEDFSKVLSTLVHQGRLEVI